MSPDNLSISPVQLSPTCQQTGDCRFRTRVDLPSRPLFLFTSIYTLSDPARLSSRGNFFSRGVSELLITTRLFRGHLTLSCQLACHQKCSDSVHFTRSSLSLSAGHTLNNVWLVCLHIHLVTTWHLGGGAGVADWPPARPSLVRLIEWAELIGSYVRDGCKVSPLSRLVLIAAHTSV